MKPIQFRGKETMSYNKTEQPTAEGAEEILDKYPHSIEYPSFVHENNAIAAMTEFATLHAQRIADKMVEKMSPSNEQIHEAALAWARDHSEAPDKDCPTWLIRDYEAGAYFVRQCYGCWNKTDKMVSERDDDVFDKMNCLIGYLERWLNNPQSNNAPAELRSVIDEAIEYLKTRDK